MSLFRKSLICAVVLTALFKLWIFLSDSDKWLTRSIDAAITASESFCGVILVTKDGKTIYEKSCIDKPSVNPQFLVASIIKQFTSALILKEVEKGHIDLGEKANKYLKDSQKINEEITVHQLLSHTSGIINPSRSASSYKRSLRFTPGTGYEYSNYSYVILGDILENVTGRKYDDLANRMLHQVGMLNSFLIDSDSLYKVQQKHPKLVSSFLIKGKKRFEMSKIATRKLVDDKKTTHSINSCGGLISTAYDLNAWNQALHNGRILSLEMYNKMTSHISKSDFPKGFYGYGVCSDNYEIYHIGYADCYKSTLSYFPQCKISLVILENISANNYEKDFRVHKSIRNIIRRYAEQNYTAKL